MKMLLLPAILLLTLLSDSYGQDVQYILDSIAVTAKRGPLKFRDNIISYDISLDSLAASKSMRMLVSQMPLVSYNQAEGKIMVNGNENILLLVNGRKSLIINKSNFNYMSEFLYGKELESISIDMSPTGSYYGYYAVIDIKTKDILSNFYSGNLGATASTAWSIAPSAALTISNGKFTANLKYDYERSKPRAMWNYTETRTSDGSSSGLFIASDTTKRRSGRSHNMGLNISYDLTSSDIIFASIAGSFSNNKSLIASFSDIDGIHTYNSTTNKGHLYGENWNVAYQHYFDKKNNKVLTFQYTLDNKASKRLYGSTANYNRFTNRQHTLSADYLHTINSSSNWNANVAWFARKYKSNSPDYVFLLHHQDVVQTTLNFTKKIGKFRLTGQAAYDFTSDRARFNNSSSITDDDYGYLRYRIRAQWFLKPGHSLTLVSNNNVYRPDIRVRNPYRDESVKGEVTQGNPLLSNEKSRTLLLSYLYMRGSKYSSGLIISYHHSSNGVFATTSTMDDGRLLHSYENGIKSDKFFISPSFTWEPSDKVSINLSYRIGWNRFRKYDKTNSYYDHFVYLDAYWRPWKNGEVNLNVSLLNPSGQIYSASTQIIRNHYMITGFLQVTQRINKSLFCGMIIKQPWYRHYNTISEFATDGHNYYSKHSERGQIIGIYLRYNFGKFRSQVKRNMQQITDKDRSKN